MARPHSPLRMRLGGLSGKVLPLLRSIGQAVALFGLHELDDDIVGDDAHRQFVDHRHVALQGFCRLRPRTAASVAIIAETKPAPPAQSEPKSAANRPARRNCRH